MTDLSSPRLNSRYVRDLVYNTRDAIVFITAYDNTITKYGNGFFIKNHYIICPSSLVTTSSFTHLNIIVDVHNVNGENETYSYNAKIIGLDGAGNIAVLKITDFGSSPEITNKHVYLKWSKSRNASPGDTIILIGKLQFDHYSVQSSDNSIIIGYLSNNRYVYPSDNVVGELLLLSGIYNISQGMPVLSLDGSIIGMTTNLLGIALSEFFMRRPIKAIIQCYSKQAVIERYTDLIKYSDNLFTYKKSWIGIHVKITNSIDFIDFQCDKKIMGFIVIDSVDIKEFEKGDIITHIDDRAIGNKKNQIAPHLILWRFKPNSDIKIIVRKFSDHYLPRELTIKTKEYPDNKDYAFYSEDLEIYNYF